MKKKFKETLTGRILIGTLDGLTGGTVSNIVYSTETAPGNKPDYFKLISSLITLYLIYNLISGKIDINTFNQLNEIIK